MPKFELFHEEEGAYRDYEFPLPDHDGIGGRIVITLVEDATPKRAYGVLLFDTINGDEVLREEFAISREIAERLVV